MACCKPPYLTLWWAKGKNEPASSKKAGGQPALCGDGCTWGWQGNGNGQIEGQRWHKAPPEMPYWAWRAPSSATGKASLSQPATTGTVSASPED